MIEFDQTNGQAEGLDGDSDGTADDDLAKKDASRKRRIASTCITGIGRVH